MKEEKALYNAIKNQTDTQKNLAKGGISTPRGFKPAHVPGQGTTVPTQQRAVKVYKPFHGQGMGPIFEKPISYSFYDLMVDREAENLRYESFEDWIFPEIDMEHHTIKPVKNVFRGSVRTSEGPSQVTRNSITQYVYVVLNPSKNLVQSYGDFGGTLIRKSDYLVCVEVGSPNGRLDAAFVQYAIPLNSPVRTCVQLATTIQTSEGYHYLYYIQGDPALEKEIFDRWFNSNDYYFNSVIYPKIRAFSDQ